MGRCEANAVRYIKFSNNFILLFLFLFTLKRFGELQMIPESIPKSQKGTLVSLLTMQFPDGIVHKVGFVVSKRRKYGDLTTVVQQTAAAKHSRLSKYGQSLFDACFKGW